MGGVSINPNWLRQGQSQIGFRHVWMASLNMKLGFSKRRYHSFSLLSMRAFLKLGRRAALCLITTSAIIETSPICSPRGHAGLTPASA
jgi:hypothetical protein